MQDYHEEYEKWEGVIDLEELDRETLRQLGNALWSLSVEMKNDEIEGNEYDKSFRMGAERGVREAYHVVGTILTEPLGDERDEEAE